MLTPRQSGLLRALLYGVDYAHDHDKEIARKISMSIEKHALDASPTEYIEAIEAALASDEEISSLSTLPASEREVRGFLAEMLATLRERNPSY